MSKTRKFRKNSKKQKRKSKTLHQNKKIYVGGLGEELGFPPCSKLTLFDMDVPKLLQFQRSVNSGTDCFTTALQIFGLIQPVSADIMRLAYQNKQVEQSAMESVFIYLTRFNFCFQEFSSFRDFAVILDQVPKGKAVFAGYKVNGTGHVFIIYRKLLGQYAIIDPQVVGPPDYNVEVDSPEDKNTFLHANVPGTKWYILKQSETQLNEDQVEYVRDIASGEPPLLARSKYMAATNPGRADIATDNSKMDDDDI
jgi:hypothetical protein